MAEEPGGGGGGGGGRRREGGGGGGREEEEEGALDLTPLRKNNKNKNKGALKRHFFVPNCETSKTGVSNSFSPMATSASWPPS